MSDHPSGRPVRVDLGPRRLPMERIPNYGALTPRLREQRQRINAIGFWHSPEAEFEDDEMRHP